MGFVTNQQTAAWGREDNQPFRNDPKFSRPTRIKRVGRGFVAAGRHIELGETVVTDAATAADMCFLGKASLVE